MVRRGWRDFLYLNNATAEAKASGFLSLEKAALSGTIENVGASAPAPKRENVFWESSDPRAKGQATHMARVKRPLWVGSSDPWRVSSVGDRRSVA